MGILIHSTRLFSLSSTAAVHCPIVSGGALPSPRMVAAASSLPSRSGGALPWLPAVGSCGDEGVVASGRGYSCGDNGVGFPGVSRRRRRFRDFVICVGDVVGS